MTQFYEEIIWQADGIPCPYPDALDFMRQQVDAIHQQKAPQRIWLTEHPPLYTAGTSARPEDLINPHGYPTFEAGRGGQWTYHGPGQRIAYVMLDLTRPHGPLPARDVRAFVQMLERWLIMSLQEMNIDAFTREGRIGVWCFDGQSGLEAKIAALGIRVTRWVSWHGISLNVSPDLSDFEGIIPCGIRDYGVTSLQRFNPSLGMQEADAALLGSWTSLFGPVSQSS
ncbi:lipoate-protein ligase B [Bombella sp. TMW2.1889]|uniref:Octanoyltransferase n=2 Tax=Bombella mellum TaxID=2039288 RepID=A0ABR5ZSJ7_9PROT|nr:lipoyl(octanoyl) transferase LipB [Bombella mellum]MBA5727164.1 lipoate-protein ligase B [Bombella mellum]